MKYWFVLPLLPLLMACSTSPSQPKEQERQAHVYDYELTNLMEQPDQKTMMIGFYVHPDTIRQHGVKSVLSTLVKERCTSPCYADLWDDKSKYELRESIPYSQQTEDWKRDNYVGIADHLVASKEAHSEEVINYPLTYSQDYKKWGGKRAHQ